MQWVSASELAVDVPPGAGSDTPVLVVMRTGTLAIGSMSYEPPKIDFAYPRHLMYGETRPRAVCGSSFGAEVVVATKVEFGGVECSSLDSASVEDTE